MVKNVRLTWVLPGIALLVLPLLGWQQWRWSRRLADDESSRLKSFVLNGASAAAAAFDQSMSDLAHDLSSTAPFRAPELRIKLQNWLDGRPDSLIAGAWMASVYADSTALHPITGVATPPDGLLERLRMPLPPIPGRFTATAAMQGFQFDSPSYLFVSPITGGMPGEMAVIAFNRRALEQFVVQPLIDSLIARPARIRVPWQIVQDSLTLLGEPEAERRFDAETAIGTLSTMRIVVLSTGTTDSVKLNWTHPAAASLSAITVTNMRTAVQMNREISRHSTDAGELFPGKADSGTSLRAFFKEPPDMLLKRGSPVLRVRYGEDGVRSIAEQRARRDLLLQWLALGMIGLGIAYAVRSARQAEDTARRQMEFVATVTHELRTPVAVIRSAAQNMADGLVGTPERTATYGSLISTESRRLGDLIENVLAFSGLSSGSVTLRTVPIDLAALIGDILEGLQQAAAAKSIRFDTEQVQAGLQINGDRTGIRLMLSNLLENAVKYSPEATTVHIRLRQPDNRIMFEVEDHGMGISSADLPHIFEPFRRGRHAVEQQIKGSGLGLHLVKKYADLHGAGLTVRSVIRSGSTFTVTFPVPPDTRDGTA